MQSRHKENEPLPLGEAFRAWSDPETLRRVDELERYAFVPMIAPADAHAPDPAGDLHDEWRETLQSLRKQFQAKLARRELVATGFAKPITVYSERCEIPVALNDILEFDYKAAEALCGDLTFVGVEVFRPTLGTSAPALVDAADGKGHEPRRRAFEHNERYTRVRIDEHVFFLTGGQCTIVRRLHEASSTPDPWVSNKDLLLEAKYSSDSLSGVFRRRKNPSWRELIEQRDGHSRLRLWLDCGPL